MRIDILTLFPDLFAPFLDWSMINKARKIKVLKIEIHNLRNWAIDKRGTVDGRPYGGGPGMILRIEPIYQALTAIKSRNKKNKPKVILLSPRGKTFTQTMAEKLSREKHLILICGHYEGVDERVRRLVDQEISVGEYVLSGGEIPAMTVVDGLSRLLPGVLEKENASEIESFSSGLKKFAGPQATLEFPQYTRPESFQGRKVPNILLSGNHQKISDWKKKKTKKAN